MKVAEIETTSEGDRETGRREWTVVYVRDGFVSIAFEFTSPTTLKRTSWQDSGASVVDEHLDWLIEALQQARAMVTGGEER